MSDELKFLIEQIERLVIVLNRYIFTIIIFTLYGLGVVLEGVDVELPFLGINFNSPLITQTIILIALVSLFAIFGSKLIEYIKKRRAFEMLLEKSTTNNIIIIKQFIPRSPYEFFYELRVNKEKSRIISVSLLSLILLCAIIVAFLINSCIFSFNCIIGVVVFIINLVIVLVLISSFYNSYYDRDSTS